MLAGLLTATSILHGALNTLPELNKLVMLTLILRAHLVQFCLKQVRLFGQVSLAHLGERLPHLGQLGLKLLIGLLLANQVAILHFNLCPQSCCAFLQIVDFFLLFLDRARQILDLFICFPGLASLLFHFYLQLVHQSVEFFNLTIFVLDLSLDSPLIFGLFFLCVFLKSRLQLIYFIESVPDLDLVLSMDYLPQAFHLLPETFLNHWYLRSFILMVFFLLDLLLFSFFRGLLLLGLTTSSMASITLTSSCSLFPVSAVSAMGRFAS